MKKIWGEYENLPLLDENTKEPYTEGGICHVFEDSIVFKQ